MFLTKVPDPGLDDYQTHKCLMEQFDGDRILFQRRGFEIHVLSRFPQESGRDVSSLIESLAVGDEVLFSLRVNPVVTKLIDGKKRRVAIPPAELSKWIADCCRKHGFEAEFTVRREGSRISRKEGHKITLFSILVTGVLTIRNFEVFQKAVENGIGHSKGLGFGLLNIFEFR